MAMTCFYYLNIIATSVTLTLSTAFFLLLSKLYRYLLNNYIIVFIDYCMKTIVVIVIMRRAFNNKKYLYRRYILFDYQRSRHVNRQLLKQ